jgi:predicted solute-binding protein
VAVRILVEERLETAMFAYPYRAGWVEGAAADGVTLASPVSADVARSADLALIDAVTGLGLLDTHVIVRDIAITWRTASMLTLTTHTRPDEVEAVTASVAGVSLTGRAVAVAVVTQFYGITVRDWTTEAHPVGPEHVTITEGPAALVAEENEDFYQEDLGRAWYLLADKPLVTHVCVAPRQLLVSRPADLAAAVARLQAARETGLARARELRRDLSKAHGIDRETLTETLADQTHHLDDPSIDGLIELAGRAGLSIGAAAIRRAVVGIERG